MIIYLHGFRSGPQSAKAQQLMAHMQARGMGDRLWCDQLPPVPTEAIALAEQQIATAIARGAVPTLVGSSLGGFYATWLAERHGLRAVLVNPFVPHEGFDGELFIGQHTNLYDGSVFDFTREHVAQIAAMDLPRPTRPENLWLLAEENDEVLDTLHAVARYAGARQTVLPGGDHSFTRWTDYLDDICRFAGLVP
ncbi:YqiA/YcfP family alpha/beta fold hydrolase [Uliginosibacterium sp. H1]|uniref:YqiA/YcfP family alpha/beta fold hydrolase n=1 Tax=Uliginosibacterium sp. H1 TaxID=3114757 RepID=UPI002E16EF70|nr:YqiA/YcfP family alpha/beta fold hydrolase [Uliginosibacterium sp. H1]